MFLTLLLFLSTLPYAKFGETKERIQRPMKKSQLKRANECPVSLEFFRSKKPLSIFLSNIKISI